MLTNDGLIMAHMKLLLTESGTHEITLTTGWTGDFRGEASLGLCDHRAGCLEAVVLCPPCVSLRAPSTHEAAWARGAAPGSPSRGRLQAPFSPGSPSSVSLEWRLGD